MRHVSRTHRVALDWLFDRIDLDPKIQIKYVDTKHQLADMLTKGNFTRDEWNNLIHLFNISYFRSLCCSQNFSLTSCTTTMAKRMQEQEGENRIVAKSKLTTMNLAFTGSTSSSTVQSPIASKSPGILKAPFRTDWSSTRKLDAKEHNHDAASSSQGWPKDAVLVVGTRKLVASGYSETEGSDKVWPHSLHISTNCVLRMEKVLSIVRQRYGLSPTDQMKDLDVNTAIWGTSMSVTLQAAVHLGKDYTEKFTIYQEIFETVFQVTERLITDQTRSTGPTTIGWQEPV